MCCTSNVNGNRRRLAASQQGGCGFSGAPLRLLAVIALLFGALTVGAQTASQPVTLAQLREDPNLTPERFGQYFRDFEFKLGAARQAPESFLAAEVLREKRYTTKLVAVFMEGQTHVVCYVEEAHGYLDYNLRKEASSIQLASGKLEEIADKVAAYFRTPWRSASEFNYEADQPRFGRIVFGSARNGSKPEHESSPRVQQTASCRPAGGALATVIPQGF
jgi:hypothetical protein